MVITKGGLRMIKIDSFVTALKVTSSRKRLRAKNTPDLHLSYSKTEGKAGMVEIKDSASKNTLYFK